MGTQTRDVLDLLIPEPWVVERQLSRMNGERDLPQKLLDVSREYAKRRGGETAKKDEAATA